MNYTMKLLIPVGLGIAAAATNWASISFRTAPVEFTGALRPLKEGEMISLGDLAPIPIPANQAIHLSKTAVPYDQMATLSGRTTMRAIEKDDLLFWSDAPERGARLDWRVTDESALSLPLGGIRIPPVSVGDHVSILLPTGQLTQGGVQREWLGPFRVLAVDGQKSTAHRSQQNQRVEELTLAIPIKMEQSHVRLMKYLDERLDNDDLKLTVRLERGR